MKTFYLKIISTFCLLFLVKSTIAQPGTLDSGFGVNGRVTASFSYPQVFYPVSVTTQKGGKILVLAFLNYWYDGANLVIMRYYSNGAIDSSFGISGKVKAKFGDSVNYIFSGASTMVIQEDDKILVGGTSYTGWDAHFRLMRFLPDGGIDSGFGMNGQVKTIISSWRETSLSDLALQADGKILAGGFVDGFCLVRYNINGTIDSLFGTNGLVYNEADFRWIVGMALTNNQKIICVVNPGYLTDTSRIEIEAVLPDGKVDSSFGINGIVATDLRIGTNLYNSLAVLPDNTFVVSGQQSPIQNQWQMALGEFKSNGILNQQFGNNGYVIQSFGSANGYAQKILLQNDGKLITAGSALARFHSNGSLDSGFGIKGASATFLPTGTVALQEDGKVLAVNKIDDYNWLVSRYKGDEPITLNFQKNISTTEGNSGTKPAQFKAVLNRPSQIDVQVNYNTIEGTAKSGSDYIAAHSTALIKAGKVAVNIPVSIIGDSIREKNEKFFLALSNPVNAYIGVNDTATGIIKNDDAMFASSSQSNADAAVKTSLIKAYPNPASNYLQIQELEPNTSISLHDIKGNIVKQAIASGSYKMNISGLAAGVYELVITTKKRVEKIKVVKE